MPMNLILTPVLAAMLSCAFVFKMVKPEGILNWWPSTANRLSNVLYLFLGQNAKDYFLAIAYRCESCIAGQLGMWMAFYSIIFRDVEINPIAYLLWSVSLSMILTLPIKLLYKIVERYE